MKKTIINESNIEGYKKLYTKMLKIRSSERKSIINVIVISIICSIVPVILSLLLKDLAVIFLLSSLIIETSLIPYVLIDLSRLKKKKIDIKNLISKEYPDIDTEIDMSELQKKLETTEEAKINDNYITPKTDSESVKYSEYNLPYHQQMLNRSNKPMVKVKKIK